MCSQCKNLKKQLNEVFTPKQVEEILNLIKERDFDFYPGHAPAQPLKDSQHLLDILKLHVTEVMKDNS